jgi:hypothetical protein
MRSSKQLGFAPAARCSVENGAICAAQRDPQSARAHSSQSRQTAKAGAKIAEEWSDAAQWQIQRAFTVDLSRNWAGIET